MTQLELDFDTLDEEHMRVLFMRMIHAAMDSDDCPYQKKTRDLLVMCDRHGKAAVDDTLIALTGWSFESLLKFTKNAFEGKDRDDVWHIDCEEFL